MKYLILAAMLLPSLSFACGRGGPSGEGYQGDKEALHKIDRKPLLCVHNGVTAESLVQTWAIYRCIGSPVRVELSGFGDSINVNDVAKDGAKIVLSTDAGSVACSVK